MVFTQYHTSDKRNNLFVKTIGLIELISLLDVHITVAKEITIITLLE